MKIRLLAPTQLELSAITFEHPNLSKRACGVGGIAMAMDLLPYIAEDKFDLIILAGLAGGIETETMLSQVVKINKDFQGDLGVFEKRGFTPFTVSGLVEKKDPNTKYNVCDDVLPKLEIMDSLSTNILFQEKDKNDSRHAHFNTQIENMEGAAFQEICEEYEVPYLQLRAVSNFIGERDKNNWQIKKSLENLNAEITKHLKSIL